MAGLHRLLREPMLHFLALGLGLFLLHGWLGGASSGQGERIVITRGRVAQIVAAYERANQRAPLPAELDGLIEDAVREEVLYREAMAMGLDRDDTIVRRRLRQKLEFVAEDLEPVAEPSDARLAAYLQAHAPAYETPPSYTLSLVYLDPHKHGSHLAADAAGLLASLRRKADVEGQGVGDAFLLPARYEKAGWTICRASSARNSRHASTPCRSEPGRDRLRRDSDPIWSMCMSGGDRACPYCARSAPRCATITWTNSAGRPANAITRACVRATRSASTATGPRLAHMLRRWLPELHREIHVGVDAAVPADRPARHGFRP
jgi:hypothetical protein